MKIFIFTTHNLWGSHLETELEIIQGHLDKNDEVYRFICNGDLPVCDNNQEHELAMCLRCRDMAVCSRKLLSKKVIELPLFNKSKEALIKVNSVLLKYNSLDEIRSLQVDNFDIGYAVLSSVISIQRNPSPDFDSNKEKFDHYINSALKLYFSTIQYINELKPDRIYVFNGRFAHVKAIFRAAQKCNIPCYIHERGHSIYYYELFKDTTPHDRKYIVNKMYGLWEKADPLERNSIGESFFNERIAGKVQSWVSFIKNQQKGLLPLDWDPSKRNIAIFNSSEDEFASVGPEWKNELYGTQIEGIKKILTDCVETKNMHFYLRIHPNLANVVNADKDSLDGLNYPNLTLIDASSPVSSYDLLLNCEKVIGFGSTVGIEAVFWGKPSILIGKSFYYELNATYKPASHQEVINMISAKLEPMDKTAALIYGHYFKIFGIKFKFYKAETIGRGAYKGVYLSDSKTWKTDLFLKLRRVKFFGRLVHYLETDFKYKKRSIPF